MVYFFLFYFSYFQVETLEGQEVTKFCPVGKRTRNVQMAKWKDVHPASRKSILEVDLDIEIKSRGRICFVLLKMQLNSGEV